MSLPDTGPTTGPTPTPPPPPTPSPTPTGPTVTPGPLSAGLTAVLRKIVTDPGFRTQYAEDPLLAITTAGIRITTADWARLSKLTPEQLEQAAEGIVAMAGGGGAGLRRAGGTNTLIYAIIVALLLA
jgi:hypothetical protein